MSSITSGNLMNVEVPWDTRLSNHQKRQSLNIIEASDLEPFTLVDELEFSRRFKDIAMMADMTDESDDATLLHASYGRHQSDYSYRTRSFEQPEGNSGFNSKLIDPGQLLLTPGPSRQNSLNPSPKAAREKSFLDDDWLLDRVEHDSTMALVASGLVRPRSAVHVQAFSAPFYQNCLSSNSASSSPTRPEPRKFFDAAPTPRDYVCKLCNVSGHWMKDCEFFEPRTNLNGKMPLTARTAAGLRSLTAPSTHQKHLPPGNYICRLCGISGHWIEQCSLFQPKSQPNKMTKEKTGPASASFKSIPPPSGYICNLCHQPGHWLQHCSRFEPIVHHGHRSKSRQQHSK